MLTRTELPRLRELGYEVFNPPYLAPIYDQSANLDWDAEQPTTLPEEVFRILSRTNFFYADFSPKIAEILNTYFDAIVVTITPVWLEPVLRHFRGPIIYRIYGQHGHLSSEIIDRKLWARLVSHPNFHIVPFCDQVVEDEAPWFRARCMASVPYSLPQDTFEHRDTWLSHGHSQAIMVSVPNIHNPFFNRMYQHLNTVYPDPFIRIYGVQRADVGDPRVVGSLDRAMLIRHFQQSAGYFYPYQDRNVCYLPPIEMMTVGGPVLFAPDSLLHRFFGGDAPGLGRTPDEIRTKMEWLRQGDAPFVHEILASQTEVRKLYDPEHVNPRFDAVMQALLDDAPPSPVPPLSIRAGDVSAGSRSGGAEPVIACLGHLHPAANGLWSETMPAEEVRERLCRLVGTLLAETPCRLILTSYAAGLPALCDRYGEAVANGRLVLHAIDHEQLQGGQDAEGQPDAVALMLETAAGTVAGTAAEATPATERLTDALLRLRCLQRLDGDPDIAAVVVPGGGLFPEAVSLSKPAILFLPQAVAISAATASPAERRRTDLLARRATLLLTDAPGMADWLAHRFGLPPARVAWVPLPEELPKELLKELPTDGHPLADDALLETSGTAPLLYAPSSGSSPDEQALLLATFSLLLETHPTARLLIGASSPTVEPEARRVAARLGVEGSVLWTAAADPRLERRLFGQAAALCIGSGAGAGRELGRQSVGARTVRLDAMDGDIDLLADALLRALDAAPKSSPDPASPASGEPAPPHGDGLDRLLQIVKPLDGGPTDAG
ncbi:hypothetical protein [Azospirillum sp. TSH100]|uniref:hypothetical protein n=1 Tax=Azospirillum sp. TSH100 TaxID=652764 RepID=UPI0010A9E24C|nr:hypothetical protein [Azospirillum sp. TSH100]QCG92195.1 hypothetical protein E6C72_30885 [Azospirillum sp. TSH100]